MDKIICLGKNYLEHAKELGDAIPEKPVLFLKPPSASIQVGRSGDRIEISLPRGRGSVHHECEILLKVNSRAEITAVSLGLDLTLRDEQQRLKKMGHPWEISKVFKGSAILGPWLSVTHFKDYLETPFSLTVNQNQKQSGVGQSMRLKPQDSLLYIRDYFPLCDGDIVFTGTPEGVGPLVPGDLAELRWGNVLDYQIYFT